MLRRQCEVYANLAQRGCSSKPLYFSVATHAANDCCSVVETEILGWLLPLTGLTINVELAGVVVLEYFRNCAHVPVSSAAFIERSPPGPLPGPWQP